MKKLNRFAIPFVGLANKLHRFSYKVDQSFFANFPDSPIHNCDVTIDLDFDKKESFFLLRFYVDGYVEVACDRCMELFKQAIFDDYELIVKLSDSEPQEEESDIIYISRSQDHLDISKIIYEYVVLSIPIQTIHSNKDEENRCNPNVIDKLNKKAESFPDPRWEILKSIKTKE